MKIIIATIKKWNIEKAKEFVRLWHDKCQIKVITSKEDLNSGIVDELCPDYIFFPHWSEYIPAEIYEKYCCVVFHMTDLPFGRGGSPLQNLIERGYRKTKISAIQVVKQVDAGPVFLKEDLDLQGSAQDIFERATEIIFKKMIPRFLNEHLTASPQSGEVVEFKRRKPEQSQINPDMNQIKIYDYIRMLDADGYPKAFIPFGNKRISFSNAELKDGKVIAIAEFTEEEN